MPIERAIHRGPFFINLAVDSNARIGVNPTRHVFDKKGTVYECAVKS